MGGNLSLTSRLFNKKFASQKEWHDIFQDEKEKMSYDQEYSTGQAVFEGES